MLLLVATGLGWWPSAAPARPLPGVTIQACGAMTVGADGARLVRPGETLEPGDSGFGCLFTAKDVPKDGAVPVEVRLLRPTAAGGTAWDRWFVALRPGRASQAVYLSETPLTTASGPWTLEIYRDGRPAARRQFVMAGGPGTSGDQDGAAQPSVETPPAGVSGEAAASPPTPAPPAPTAPASSDQSAPTASAPIPPASAHSAAAIPAPAPVPPATPRPVPSPASPASVSPGVVASKPAPLVSPPAKPAAPAPAKREVPVKKNETARPAPAAPERKDGNGASEKPQGTGYYALQLGVFAQPDNAEALAVKVRGRGVPVCVAEERTAKGRRYRVMAGRYGDRRVALDRRREVRIASGVEAVLYHVEPAAIDRLRCH